MTIDERLARVAQLAEERASLWAQAAALPSAAETVRYTLAAGIRKRSAEIVEELKALQAENIQDFRDLVLALRENARLQGAPEVALDLGGLPPSAARRLMTQAFPSAREEGLS